MFRKDETHSGRGDRGHDEEGTISTPADPRDAVVICAGPDSREVQASLCSAFSE